MAALPKTVRCTAPDHETTVELKRCIFENGSDTSSDNTAKEPVGTEYEVIKQLQADEICICHGHGCVLVTKTCDKTDKVRIIKVYDPDLYSPRTN